MVPIVLVPYTQCSVILFCKLQCIELWRASCCADTMRKKSKHNDGVSNFVLFTACTALLVVMICLISISKGSEHVLENIIKKRVSDSPSHVELPAVTSLVPISVPNPVTISTKALVTQSPPEGVAVALLLHAPKWFQHRYTMMVSNIHSNIPPTWKIQLFYIANGGSQKGIDNNPGLQKLIAINRVILTEIPIEIAAKKQKKKKYIMFDPWFWQSMLSDRVLIFGGNSALCGNSPRSLSDFYEYDYVGSPWNSVKGGVGGDGGISLRNRKVMLQALEYMASQTPSGEDPDEQYKKWGYEDQQFVKTLLDMKKLSQFSQINLAPKSITRQWGAKDGFADFSVLTASGTLADIGFGERGHFLDYCIELKMIYPLLHEPGCFGAKPNATKCAASICALNHKGGC